MTPPRSLRVLLVEDDPIDAELICSELQCSGLDLNIQRVGDRSAFLAGMSSGPDVIVTDLRLPQFSGLEALELAQQYGLAVPLILVSGLDEDEFPMHPTRAGVAGIISKSHLEELGPLVRRVLAHPESAG